MDDIPGWLRGFQRSRIPSTAPPSDYLSLVDEANQTAEETYNVPSTTGMPSYQNFARVTAASSSVESHPCLNQVDQIWHNPDPGQMAETLKVAMMTQNSFDPLCVSYNSCILHVLESYQSMRKELLEKDLEIRDRKQKHDDDIKSFREQQLQWKREEERYKSELKKLEVMLATGARGLELVTLVRSRSALNGATRAVVTQRQQPKRERERRDLASDEELMMADFAERKDSFVSASHISYKRMLDGRHTCCVPPSRQSQRSETLFMIGQPCHNTKHDSKNDKAYSDTTYSEELCDMASSEIDSSSLLWFKQEAKRCHEQHKRPLGELINKGTDNNQDRRSEGDSKPLLEVPCRPKELNVNGLVQGEEDNARPYRGEKAIGNAATHHGGFSFIPGDDYGSLTLGTGKTQAITLAPDGFRNKEEISRSYLPLNPGTVNLFLGEKPRRVRPAVGERGETIRVRERKVTTCREFAPTYSDSQTNVVTIADHYRGSSKCSEHEHEHEHVKDAPGRPNISHLSGSNEATIAAVRAIAESGKSSLRAP